MSDPTTFTLDNAWVVEFPTEPAGVLRLGPGRVRVDAAFRLRERGEDDWYAVIDCDLRLADADGKVWQATSTFLSNGLFYHVIDLARPEPGRWLRNAPAAWREALEQRPMLSDVPATYDDRFYRYVWLDNTGFCWQFKYFAATFTLAAFDESTLVVSADQVFCSWNPLPGMGPDGPLPVPPRRPPLSQEEQAEELDRLEESGEAGDFDHQQAVAYLIEAGRLLFRDTAMHDEDEGWNDQPTSRPLVFRRS